MIEIIGNVLISAALVFVIGLAFFSGKYVADILFKRKNKA